MLKAWKLTCTGCGQVFGIHRMNPRCDACREPLEMEKVQGRVNAGQPLGQGVFSRYADFFPFREDSPDVTLGEGLTPLIPSARLAPEMAVSRLFFKNETQNPTWSFKDRGTAAGLRHALACGFQRIGTVSTGNMAVSVAAYGARAGIDTVVLVSAELPAEKLGPIALHRPRLFKVRGDYGRLYFESLTLGAAAGIAFINSDVPLRVEGSKTIAFEICEQLDFEAPDWVVVPTSAGGNFRGILKGFEEFHRSGLIERVPKMVCAQARGCAPIHSAFQSGSDRIRRVENPHTLAHAIENPYPPSGNQVLRKLRENGGCTIAVDDSEIIEAQKALAREGIFGQLAAAVPLAAVKVMRDGNLLHRKDTVVCIVTGSGLKVTAALEHHTFQVDDCPLEDLEERVHRVLAPAS